MASLEIKYGTVKLKVSFLSFVAVIPEIATSALLSFICWKIDSHPTSLTLIL